MYVLHLQANHSTKAPHDKKNVMGRFSFFSLFKLFARMLLYSRKFARMKISIFLSGTFLRGPAQGMATGRTISF